VLRASLHGGGRETDEALLRGLDWLIRHQAPDGGWEAEDGESRVGTTGLALLAFLGAGFTTWAQEDCLACGCRSGPSPAYRGPPLSHHQAVRRAVAFLVRAQNADGFIGTRGSTISVRDHAIAAQALSEAYGQSGLRSLAEPAIQAIQALESDDAAAGWTALALRSAAICGVPFSWTLSKGLGLAPAAQSSSAPPLLRGALDIFMWRHDQEVRRREAKDPPSIRPLLDHRPTWQSGAMDPHAWYWGTLALSRWDGPGGRDWKAWHEPLQQALLGNQESGSGEHRGSWAPPGRGRTISTVLFSLTLTVYYRPAVYVDRPR